MTFTIRHRTRYHYPRPVFLEPHILRLRPRCDGSQQVRHCHIEVQPAPAGMSEGIDTEGNGAAFMWFDGLVEDLVIDAQIEVETFRHNPFDFLVTDEGVATLPARYAPPQPALLAQALRPQGDPEVARFAAELVESAAEPGTLAFLTELTQRLFQSCEVVIRELGEPYPPGQTLHTWCGSCRDLTVLFMEACRSQGLAARFVSGYQEGDPDQERRYLHAWPEVYLPGAGWRGYDPTLGLVVADRHVATAASVLPQEAGPVTGTYRGDGGVPVPEVQIELMADGSGEALPSQRRD